MSDYLLDAEVAVEFAADASLGVIVLAVLAGQQMEVPDLIDTVEIVWAFHDRPGAFVHRVGLVGDWREAAHFGIMMQKYQVEQIYGLLGGWPPATLPDTGGGPPDAV